MSVDQAADPAVPDALAEVAAVLVETEVRFCVEVVTGTVYRATVPLAHAVGMREALMPYRADSVVLPTGRGDVTVQVRHVVAFWTEPVEES